MHLPGWLLEPTHLWLMAIAVLPFFAALPLGGARIRR
jgi:hypothetical protein